MLDNETYKSDLKKRLKEKLNFTEEQTKFLLGLMKSIYCAEGSSLYAINDYIDKLKERGLL